MSFIFFCLLAFYFQPLWACVKKCAQVWFKKSKRKKRTELFREVTLPDQTGVTVINRPPVLLKVVRSYSTTIYTGVIQEQSERKRVVKSEVVKVNHCEPKSGDKCRNRKVHH